MKPLLLLVASLIVAGTITASAATEQWTSTIPFAQILQIVADGSGGCVVMGLTTNAHYMVIRYDKKGEVVYDNQFASGVVCLGLAKVTKSTFTYWLTASASYYLVQVDKHGAEDTISQPGYGYLPAGITVYQSTYSDKKGFFSSKVVIGPPAIWYVARFTDK